MGWPSLLDRLPSVRGKLIENAVEMDDAAMEAYLEGLGYLGMFISAFLAGSILPFSSELVLISLYKSKFSFSYLLFFSSLGNTLGGMLGYVMGYYSKLEWIEKYMKVKHSKLRQIQGYLKSYGAGIAFLCWLPVVGDPIGIALGLFRVRPYWVALNMLVGKAMRYNKLLTYIFLI